MNTRFFVDRTSPLHVSALNAIDMEFCEKRLAMGLVRVREESKVLSAWREYYNHLNTPAEKDLGAWNTRSDELFTNLLQTMSASLGYHFQRPDLQRSFYYPTAFTNRAQFEQVAQKSLVGVLSGELPLSIRLMRDRTQQPSVEAVKKELGVTPGSDKSRQLEAFKVRCPDCQGELRYSEGCMTCDSCGFSKC